MENIISHFSVSDLFLLYCLFHNVLRRGQKANLRGPDNTCLLTMLCGHYSHQKKKMRPKNDYNKHSLTNTQKLFHRE